MPEPGSTTLTPVLRWFRVFAIALAAISPTTSVFLVYGAGLAGAGTGVAWSFLLAAVIAVSMAFAYAELGSAAIRRERAAALGRLPMTTRCPSIWSSRSIAVISMAALGATSGRRVENSGRTRGGSLALPGWPGGVEQAERESTAL